MLVWICLFLALDKQPGGPDVVIEAFDALQPRQVATETEVGRKMIPIINIFHLLACLHKC
jgi:hypothetical protein